MNLKYCKEKKFKSHNFFSTFVENLVKSLYYINRNFSVLTYQLVLLTLSYDKNIFYKEIM